ncbi:MAG: hypothetical protein J4O08_05380, partial [Chloroflexi bacterium]|nr:hypothetical protein [Chloroflexota bacterium]
MNLSSNALVYQAVLPGVMALLMLISCARPGDDSGDAALPIAVTTTPAATSPAATVESREAMIPTPASTATPPPTIQ